MQKFKNEKIPHQKMKQMTPFFSWSEQRTTMIDDKLNKFRAGLNELSQRRGPGCYDDRYSSLERKKEIEVINRNIDKLLKINYEVQESRERRNSQESINYSSSLSTSKRLPVSKTQQRSISSPSSKKIQIIKQFRFNLDSGVDIGNESNLDRSRALIHRGKLDSVNSDEGNSTKNIQRLEKVKEINKWKLKNFIPIKKRHPKYNSYNKKTHAQTIGPGYYNIRYSQIDQRQKPVLFDAQLNRSREYEWFEHGSQKFRNIFNKLHQPFSKFIRFRNKNGLSDFPEVECSSTNTNKLKQSKIDISHQKNQKVRNKSSPLKYSYHNFSKYHYNKIEIPLLEATHPFGSRLERFKNVALDVGLKKEGIYQGDVVKRIGEHIQNVLNVRSHQEGQIKSRKLEIVSKNSNSKKSRSKFYRDMRNLRQKRKGKGKYFSIGRMIPNYKDEKGQYLSFDGHLQSRSKPQRGYQNKYKGESSPNRNIKIRRRSKSYVRSKQFKTLIEGIKQ